MDAVIACCSNHKTRSRLLGDQAQRAHPPLLLLWRKAKVHNTHRNHKPQTAKYVIQDLRSSLATAATLETQQLSMSTYAEQKQNRWGLARSTLTPPIYLSFRGAPRQLIRYVWKEQEWLFPTLVWGVSNPAHVRSVHFTKSRAFRHERG